MYEMAKKDQLSSKSIAGLGLRFGPRSVPPARGNPSNHARVVYLHTFLSKLDLSTNPTLHITTMEAALKTFFTSSRFAVVGASSDPTKFGHKGAYLIVTWIKFCEEY
jgi:hypothetical protein